MAQGLAVALHFVLASLGEREPQPVSVGAGAGEIDGEGTRRAIGEGDTLPPAREVGARHRRRHLGLVDARHAVARVQQAVGERAVVGEQQRAFDVGVQPTHRKQAGAAGQQIRHDRPALRITQRGHDAAGLVQENVLVGGGAG